MARTAVDVTNAVVTGVILPYASAHVDGNMFANDGNVAVHIKNASGAPVTATFQTPAKVGGVDVAELAVSVPAGSDRLVGPFATGVFNQSTGEVYVDFSAQASVTLAVIRIR